MNILGLQKLTLIDYPDKLACTVFLAGCNFRCPWCYSKELVLPEITEYLSPIPQREFFKFLKERKKLLEGVVVCGGEPTLCKNLPSFVKKIKTLGYLVKLDTNGSNPEMIKKLIDEKLIDYLAMDIKAPLRAKDYNKAAGIKTGLKNVLKSIATLKDSKLEHEFRTTVIPTIHTKQDIIQIARVLSPAKKYYLQNFRAEKTIDPKFEKIKPYPEEYLRDIQKAIEPFFDLCQIR